MRGCSSGRRGQQQYQVIGGGGAGGGHSRSTPQISRCRAFVALVVLILAAYLIAALATKSFTLGSEDSKSVGGTTVVTSDESNTRAPTGPTEPPGAANEVDTEDATQRYNAGHRKPRGPKPRGARAQSTETAEVELPSSSPPKVPMPSPPSRNSFQCATTANSLRVNYTADLGDDAAHTSQKREQRFSKFLIELQTLINSAPHGMSALDAVCRRWPSLTDEAFGSRGTALVIGHRLGTEILQMTIALRRRGFKGPLVAVRPIGERAFIHPAVRKLIEEPHGGDGDADQHPRGAADLSDDGGKRVELVDMLDFVVVDDAQHVVPATAVVGDALTSSNPLREKLRAALANATSEASIKDKPLTLTVINDWESSDALVSNPIEIGEQHLQSASDRETAAKTLESLKKWREQQDLKLRGVDTRSLPSITMSVLEEIESQRRLWPGSLLLLNDALGDPKLRQLRALFDFLEKHGRQLCVVAASRMIPKGSDFGDDAMPLADRGLLFKVLDEGAPLGDAVVNLGQ